MWLRGIPLELLCFNQGSGSGGNSGTSGEGTGAGDGGGSGGTGDGDKGKEGGSGDDKAGTEGKTYTQAEVEAMVRDKQAQWKRGQETRDDAARRAADEAALTEKEEFKTLAGRRGERVTELEGQVTTLTQQVEGLTPRAEKAEAALAGMLKTQIDSLSKPLADLLGRMSPTEQAEWLAANADAVKQDTTTAVPNHGSSGAGNSGAGTANAGQTWLASRYGPRDAAGKK